MCVNYIIAIIIVVSLFFIVGAFLGALGIVYPLARKPGSYLAYIDRRLQFGKLFSPPHGLRDQSGNLIKPGNLVMMLPDGNLLIISKDVPRKST